MAEFETIRLQHQVTRRSSLAEGINQITASVCSAMGTLSTLRQTSLQTSVLLLAGSGPVSFRHHSQHCVHRHGFRGHTVL